MTPILQSNGYFYGYIKRSGTANLKYFTTPTASRYLKKVRPRSIKNIDTFACELWYVPIYLPFYTLDFVGYFKALQ